LKYCFFNTHKSIKLLYLFLNIIAKQSLSKRIQSQKKQRDTTISIARDLQFKPHLYTHMV